MKSYWQPGDYVFNSSERWLIFFSVIIIINNLSLNNTKRIIITNIFTITVVIFCINFAPSIIGPCTPPNIIVAISVNFGLIYIYKELQKTLKYCRRCLYNKSLKKKLLIIIFNWFPKIFYFYIKEFKLLGKNLKLFFIKYFLNK